MDRGTRTIGLGLASAVLVTLAASSSFAGPSHSRPELLISGTAVPAAHEAGLNGVSVVDAHDVWAVGAQQEGDVQTTLIEHYDGTSWSVVPSPDPVGYTLDVLFSVDAVSAEDVWAVGSASSSTAEDLLIEHWNGTDWRIVSGPDLEGAPSALNAVSAVAAKQVFAVGFSSYPFQTLALRWNGTAWHTVDTPAPPDTVRTFLGVDATDARHAWAVGSTFATVSFVAKSLALHWNGDTWHRAAVPSPGSGYNQLRSVSVVGPGDVWAVGDFNNGSSARFALVAHRHAGRWVQVKVPGVGVGQVLTSVSGDGPDDVWMVGGKGGRQPSALIVHWNGHHWTRYGGPAAPSTQLNEVVAHGITATWAVGTRSASGHTVATHERWNGHVWTR